MVKDDSAKPGSWKGTFRFQGSQTLKLGGRYWYYYIVDGYHVSHDPAKEFVTEKTTGRKLNVLNVPAGPSTTKASRPTGLTIQTREPTSKRHSREIAQGRALSPTRIACPRPQKPYASRQLREADYELSPIDDLEERFASSRISDRSRHYYASSPSTLSDSSSSGPEFSDPGSAVSGRSRGSNMPECRCGRVGVTRDGRRIKLDCGGRRCAQPDTSDSDCNSSDSESDSEDERILARRNLQAKMRMAARPAKGGRPVILERRP